MMFRMPDKESHTVLITGASSGFGRRTAFTLARAGYRVYASMRDTAWKNRRAAEEIQAEAKAGELPIEVIDLDVAKPESVQSAVREIEGSGSTIDVLVNNAGHMSIGIAEAFTDEQVQQQLDVNFLGPVRLCRAVLPQMRERRSGLIIHISSIVGRVLFPACAFYCASKFALEAYAEVLHYELTSFGIDSVLIEPGPYPTQLLANSPGPADKDRVQTYGPFSSLPRDVLGQL